MVFSTICNCGISTCLVTWLIFSRVSHCFDSVLNMCVHDMLCLFLRPSDRHLNGLISDRNSRVCKPCYGLLHRTLLKTVLRESLGGLCQFLHNWQNWCVNDLLHIPLLDSILAPGSQRSSRKRPTVGSKLSFPRPVPVDLHNRVINHLVKTLQLWSLYGLLNSLVHGDLSLRHDRDIIEGGQCHGQTDRMG